MSYLFPICVKFLLSLREHIYCLLSFFFFFYCLLSFSSSTKESCLFLFLLKPTSPAQKEIDTRVAAAAAKSLQSCLTVCDPIDGSPPGSPIPGILQARTLEWVAVSFSNVWKWKVKVKLLSCVWFFPTPWTAAYQAPPSMGFSRQEYWSGLTLPFLDIRVKKLECTWLVNDIASVSIFLTHVFAY